MTIDEALRVLIREVVREELERILSRLTTPSKAPKTRVTVEEAAEMLFCSTRSVRRYIAQGKLRATRVTSGGGSRLLISRESLDELTGGDR